MEIEHAGLNSDDGNIRTGTVWTATAHAFTAIVGSGVLTLPWSVAQLGWLPGVLVLLLFAFVTYYTAILLSDCYRAPDPINGSRNYKYQDAVKAFLGKKAVTVCGVLQYIQLWGTLVGYTITAAISIMAVDLSNCYHKNGRKAACKVSWTMYVVGFGIAEVFLSQLPDLENIAFLSYIAAAMSFAYSFISLYLCVVQLFTQHDFKGNLFGVKIGHDISTSTKIWHSFQALGNIAFAYTYSMVLIEIQNTLRSPPSENKTMKKANMYSIAGTTLFYVLLGCSGYAAFGSKAPGNILTGFYEPFWLIDIANIAVIIHLGGAYQLFCQPLFAFYEQWLAAKFPNSSFFNKAYTIKACLAKPRYIKFTLCKVIVRTVFITLTTVVALMLPFFNAVVGILGALGFWPLTVYFPVAMHIAQTNTKKWSIKWLFLQSLSLVCLLVSIVSIIASIVDISQHLKSAKLFKMEV